MLDKNARTIIHEIVENTRAGNNPLLITRLETCWVVACDLPFLPGHCVTLSDPVVFSINDLDEETRIRYSRDVYRVGDALMQVTGSYRINYETLCNGAQSLHSHIIPRYLTEPQEKRTERAAVSYPQAQLVKVFSAQIEGFLSQMRKALA